MTRTFSPLLPSVLTLKLDSGCDLRSIQSQEGDAGVGQRAQSSWPGRSQRREVS